MSPSPSAFQPWSPVITALMSARGTCTAITPMILPSSPTGDITHSVGTLRLGTYRWKSVTTKPSELVSRSASRYPVARFDSRYGPSSRSVPRSAPEYAE